MSNTTMTIHAPIQPTAFAVGSVGKQQGSRPTPSRGQALRGNDGLVERRVAQQAAKLLESHPHFRGRGQWVHCRCSTGTLELSGVVPTYHLKQLAQEALRQLGGDRQIVNHLRVTGIEGILDCCLEPASTTMQPIRKPR